MVLQPHIRCDIEQGARYAILPGDPQRVDRVAEFLDSVEFIAFNREHKTMRGSYKGVPVLVTSYRDGGCFNRNRGRRVGTYRCGMYDSDWLMWSIATGDADGRFGHFEWGCT